MNKTCCDMCGKTIKLVSAYDTIFIRNTGRYTSETRIDICSKCREKLALSISSGLTMDRTTRLGVAIREILLRGTDEHDCLPIIFEEDL